MSSVVVLQDSQVVIFTMYLFRGALLWTTSKLVHGWDSIKNLNCHSLLGLSTHKNVECYPTMTKEIGESGLQRRRSFPKGPCTQ